MRIQVKVVATKITKRCAVCGKQIRVRVYPGGRYRGGHYFGIVPVGRRKRVEYWECPTCYQT